MMMEAKTTAEGDEEGGWGERVTGGGPNDMFGPPVCFHLLFSVLSANGMFFL
jgi:hypothetical protein